MDDNVNECSCSCVTWQSFAFMLSVMLLGSGIIALAMYPSLPHDTYIKQTKVLNENTGKYQPHYTEYTQNSHWLLYGTFALIIGSIATIVLITEIWFKIK